MPVESYIANPNDVIKHIPVRELFAPFKTSFCSTEDWVLVLIGYIDESYSQENPPKTFALSCLFASASEWSWIEGAWLNVLDKKNAELSLSGRKRIQRVHAVDLNNFKNDFEGWGPDERLTFSEKLCSKVFNRHEMFHASYTVNLREAIQVWPAYEDKPLAFAYEALLLNLMDDIGWLLNNAFVPRLSESSKRITLIHERCAYDGVLLNTFNHAIAREDFLYRSLYVSLAPMPWECCVPLQLADFAATESMKEAYRFEHWDAGEPLRKRRLSLEAMHGGNSFGHALRHLSIKDLVEARINLEQKHD